MTRYNTSQTVTAPSAGTYDIGVWGGGGGGSNSTRGGGGGGGAFSYASVVVSAGDELVLTIPNAAAVGSAGGTVTVVRNSVTLASALGGSGGPGSTSAGLGGTTGGVGSTKFAGGNGGGGSATADPEFPTTIYEATGGGGGAAGRGGVGGAGQPGVTDQFGTADPGAQGIGNTSYAGTEFDGGNGGVGPGGGGRGLSAGAKGAVELIFTASDTTPPTITTNAAQSNQEGSPLAVALTADEGISAWSIRTSAQNGASVDYTHFEISGTTLRWTGNGVKDFESPGDTGANNTYVVVVRAVDNASNATDKTITVTVTDKADETAPTITHAANHNVNENAALAIALTANESVAWSIVGGTDAADFEISGSTLRWAGNVTRDYEAPADANLDNVYGVTVRATDPSSNFSDLAMTVTVLDVTAGDIVFTGQQLPTSGAQDASGTMTWTSPGNITTDNAAYASVGSNTNSAVSNILTASGFDLSAIPDGAIIYGIEVVAEMQGSSGSGSRSNTLSFKIKGAGTAKTQVIDRLTTLQVFTFGGSTDVWGLSGGDLTGAGLKSGFDVEVTAQVSASGSGTTNTQIDYIKVRVWYLPLDALTASNIATSAAAIASATVAQVHGLGASSIATSSPAVATATVGQRHALVATANATAAPAIASATVGQRHALTASNVTTSAPAIDSETLGQRHALGASNLATAAPAIQTAAAVAVVALTANNINTQTPVIFSATVGQRHALTATSLATSAAAIQTSAIAQRHSLTASGVATSAPAIQTATATRIVNLVPNNLATSAPAIGTRTLGQAHNLAANGLSTVAPAIGPPTLGQRHALIATNSATAAPSIQTAALGQAHQLSAGSIATASPAIASASILQVHAFASTNVATAAPAISLGQMVVLPTEQMFARPIFTAAAGGWTTESGGTDLASSIDEAVANDADFIKSAPNVVDDVCRIKLDINTDDLVRDVTLRYRLRRTGTNAGMTQTVRLYEGGGNVLGAGTLVAGPFVHNVTAPTTFEQSIDPNSVANPKDLYIEVEAG